MTYQCRQVADNAYEITTDFEGNPITFNVIVASDESEVPELVEHHLSYLSNPAPVYSEQVIAKTPDLKQIVQQQSEQIQALTERLASLESA